MVAMLGRSTEGNLEAHGFMVSFAAQSLVKILRTEGNSLKADLPSSFSNLLSVNEDLFQSKKRVSGSLGGPGFQQPSHQGLRCGSLPLGRSMSRVF